MSRPPSQVLERLGAEGAPARVERRVAGGDISHAWRLRQGPHTLFCKVLPDAPDDFFSAEAAGLDWLDQGALPVARVRDVGRTWIVLDWIDEGSPGVHTDEALGRGLAGLHASLPEHASYDQRLLRDTFIGRLPQSNAPIEGGWAAFYRERRLRPQVQQARDLLGPALTRRLERLARSLPDRLADPEPPARLHGDLWSGNWLVDHDGRPVLIDPAAGPGHREVDLAMMKLFGGFSERVFDAYHQARPLQPGWRERLPLYQLYYLLVHVNLFGRAWVGRVQGCLDRLGA